MVKITINKNAIDKKLCDYVKEISPTLTVTKIKKEINRGQVKVNGKKVMDNYLLKENDELSIFLNIKKQNFRFLDNKLKVPIFYEDENIIIFDKPKNISCQENINEKINTLNNFLKKYCYLKKYWDGYDNESEPTLIHRLDQNTMGLVLAAKNKDVARILNKSFNDEITKKYLTVIYAKPPKRHQLLVDYIVKDEKQSNKMIVSKQNSKFSSQIKTSYSLIYTNNSYSILEIELLTGKKHQIRAHLAFYKMYIVGDGKYGIKNHNLKLNTQLLISNNLKFNLTNKKLSYLNKKDFTKIKDPISLLDLIK